MRRTGTVVALALVLCAFVPSVRAEQHGVQMVDQKWIAAAKAGDVNAVVALYAPDAVYYDVGLKEARGTDEIRKAYTAWFNAMTISDVQVDGHYDSSGDLSAGWGLWTLTMTPKAGGSPQTLTARVTAVAKKVGGNWRYVVDHASVPMPAH